MDSIDNVRSRVTNKISVSYNILAINQTLMNELRKHSIYLNKLGSSFGLLQEAQIVKSSRLRYKFETDAEEEKFIARREVISSKLKECSSMNVLSAPAPSEKCLKFVTLDEFHHPELDEKEINSSRKPRSPRTPDSNLSNQLSSPKITSPMRRLRQPIKLFEGHDSFILKPSSSKLGTNARRQVSMNQERVLIAEIFQLMQEKAFISQRYGAGLPEIDKLELILRLCKGYH